MDHLLISLLNTAVGPSDSLDAPLGAASWWAACGTCLDGKPRFDHRLASALRTLRGALQTALGQGQVPALPVLFRGDAADGILFEVLHAARIAVACGMLRRIRICAYQGCGRYFKDNTKNESQRWCSLRCMERARAPRRRTITR